MKRYKKELTFEKMASRYKHIYFFSFSIGFLVLSIVVGVVVFFITSSSMYRNAQAPINVYLNQYVERVNGTSEQKPQILHRPLNPNMSAVVYYVNDSNEIVDYQIIGADYSEDYYKAIEEDFIIENDEDKFIVTVLNDSYYLSKLIKISNINYQKEDLTGYVKVYNNVDAEYDLRSRIVRIYIFTSVIVFVASLGLGFIIMVQGTKPLNMLIKKQMNFVSDASHELRTPLAVVQSKIETILSQSDKTVYDVSEELAVSLNEVNRLTKLTKELLTLAHSDKDNIDINYSVFDCNEVLKDIVEPFVEIAALEGKALTYEGTSCLVKLDKDILKQIMIIHIDNALKYTGENNEIKIILKTVKEEVIIEINDTGLGMSDEDKKKAFERFYRADKARSRETGGNGLGLSIAYTLVNLQKGDIKIYDNTPKGTKFIICFPKAKEKDISQAQL